MSLLPVQIYTIERQNFPLLRECLYGSLQQTRNISPQSWNLFYEVIGFVPSSKLKLLLAAQPVSDITIVECRDKVQYAYLTIAEVCVRLLYIQLETINTH